MKVEFADSFWESLRKLKRRNSLPYRIKDFFQYEIPNFLRNLWFFRKELWTHHHWDYNYTLRLFGRSLYGLSKVIENGNEIDQTRLKKVDKIRRVLELLKNIEEDNFYDRARKQLGLPEISSKPITSFEDIFPKEENERVKELVELTISMENSEWEELWTIIKGTNPPQGVDNKMIQLDSNQDDTSQIGAAEEAELEYIRMTTGDDMRSWWD